MSFYFIIIYTYPLQNQLHPYAKKYITHLHRSEWIMNENGKIAENGKKLACPIT